jgi:hypothetical protein
LNTKLKIVNNLIEEPLKNGFVEVEEVKRTFLGFLRVYKKSEISIDSNGIAQIEIDSLSKYSLNIFLIKNGFTQIFLMQKKLP